MFWQYRFDLENRTSFAIKQYVLFAWVPGAVGLLFPQTLPGGYLKLDPRFNSPEILTKRCKTIRRLQRDCILKWDRLNPERISQFLDRLASEPKWQIAFQGIYNSLRLLHLMLNNKDARTVELQLKHRVEFLQGRKKGFVWSNMRRS